MAATTGRTIVQGAYQILGAVSVLETPDANLMAYGLKQLNWMVPTLNLQYTAIPVRAIQTFALIAGKGGPSNPYTMGPGGDFDAPRPMRLEGASLVLTQSQPNPVEVPLALFTDDGYEAVQIKDLANSQPTGVWYQPTSPLAAVYLWPVPNVSYNTLRLYVPLAIFAFGTLDASYDAPPGYEEMLVYNLALRLADPVGRPMPESVPQLAAMTLSNIKRANIRLTDMPQDIFTGNRRYGYNIQTDGGSAGA